MSISFLSAEYLVEPDDVSPPVSLNANPVPPPSSSSPVHRAPGRIADYDPLNEASPSPYSARQAATTVIYTSDKGAGEGMGNKTFFIITVKFQQTFES